MHNEIKEQQSEREKGEKIENTSKGAQGGLSHDAMGTKRKEINKKLTKTNEKNWNRELREQKKLNGKTSLDKRLIRLWSTHIYL